MGDTKMQERKSDTLCSVWDFCHFTALKAMTIAEIVERFGCKRSTAEHWRDIALELGVEIAEVPTPEGVAYRTSSLLQGHKALNAAFDENERLKRVRHNEAQRRYREKQKTAI